jgi:hypothetical protein
MLSEWKNEHQLVEPMVSLFVVERHVICVVCVTQESQSPDVTKS